MQNRGSRYGRARQSGLRPDGFINLYLLIYIYIYTQRFSKILNPRNISLYLTIIPRARVGYNHLISNKREWNNCFIKNRQEILIDLADFALQDNQKTN